jgi:hypothetical protein
VLSAGAQESVAGACGVTITKVILSARGAAMLLHPCESMACMHFIFISLGFADRHRERHFEHFSRKRQFWTVLLSQTNGRPLSMNTLLYPGFTVC